MSAGQGLHSTAVVVKFQHQLDMQLSGQETWCQQRWERGPIVLYSTRLF